MADFHKDLRVLLEEESALVEFVDRLAAGLRDLDDGEIDALAAILGPEAGALVRESGKRLQEHDHKRADEILAPPLERYWQVELKKWVGDDLQALAAN